MSTTGAALLGLIVLTLAGAVPVLLLVGWRWYAAPLAPLAGAVIASVSVTLALGLAGSLALWFPLLSVAAALASLTGAWWRAGRPHWPVGPPATRRSRPPGYVIVGVLGVVAIAAVIAWCLHSLSDPTVGFDARSFWITRAGWFLASHGQFHTDMTNGGSFLYQETYPPLVSAAVAVTWWVSGTHTDRLGVVVTTALNVCALGAAAFAVVELGRQSWRRCWARRREAGRVPVARRHGRRVRVGIECIPAVIGVVLAPLLVVTAYGLAEPFMTNGYADPLWSLAAVGAVAYGLQAANGRSTYRAALILAVVAGMSKEEGTATAACILVLIVVRRLAQIPATERRQDWWRPVLPGAVGLVLIGAWPVTVRLLGLSTSAGPGPRDGSLVTRAQQTVDGLSPYLHVLVVAAAVAIVGGVLLSGVRRALDMGNDLWAWIALAVGLAVIGYAFVFGTENVPYWMTSTASRVTELERFLAWWIIAGWAVTATAVPAWRSLLVGDRRPAPDGSTVLPPI